MAWPIPVGLSQKGKKFSLLVIYMGVSVSLHMCIIIRPHPMPQQQAVSSPIVAPVAGGVGAIWRIIACTAPPPHVS